jgi:hypothetical protein
VLRLAGREVRTPEEMELAVEDGLRTLASGAEVQVEIERDGKTVKVTLFSKGVPASTPGGR